ncbi:Thaumatin-like protein [Acorus calamus]|uniref:Thaumatin-like protein n=1 Tax=Acorus calamus TaxID=4465 RepID=A0AAV9FHG3_ACOCL|nr:Thaumatin-like protein [Acorus calamus]
MASTLMLTMLFSLLLQGVKGATFTFINKCDHPVWPGILSSAGSPPLGTTGFELPHGTTQTFDAPTGWSGRFWGRTGCKFDSSGRGTCTTGDCGSDQVACNGAGAAPPATLAEFTLGSPGSKDFYDVSLVDGYNLPMMVDAAPSSLSSGAGACGSTGCVADLNARCPAELRTMDGTACRSACEAFGKPEYCCSGEFGSPDKCAPSVYSQMFKSACPRSYSYAYDDATSTFTCASADYTITFCPDFTSLKSSRDSTQPKAAAAASTTPPTTTSPPETTGVMFADSWLASLATADANTHKMSSLHDSALTVTFIACCLLISSLLVL